MKADPRFPDRPTHSDFDRLSDAAIKQDHRAERMTLDAILLDYCDPDSVRYLAMQRAAMACRDFDLPAGMVTTLAACFIDGFTVGAEQERHR